MKLCEVCEEPNGDSLLADEYELVCRNCAENGDAAIAEGDEIYRRIVECRGCGNVGPINYDGLYYYCGGSQYCIP